MIVIHSLKHILEAIKSRATLTCQIIKGNYSMIALTCKLKGDELST